MMRFRKYSRARLDKSRGFTLMEVLVAVTVVAVGLLGLAKLQAASVSVTQSARVRSMTALQGESLASSMRANKAYWSSGVAPATWSVAAGVVTDSTSVLSASGIDCTGTNSCTPAQIAAFDSQRWATELKNHFPAMTAQIDCTTNIIAPISCRISMSWSDKVVAVNNAAAAGTPAAPSTKNYVVLVQP